MQHARCKGLFARLAATRILAKAIMLVVCAPLDRNLPVLPVMLQLLPSGSTTPEFQEAMSVLAVNGTREGLIDEGHGHDGDRGLYRELMSEYDPILSTCWQFINGGGLNVAMF
jgi:hypothetical protein